MKDVGFDRPHAKHSLAEAMLVIAFQDELKGDRMDLLHSIREKLEGDFNRITPNQAVNFTVSQGKSESSSSFNGWTLESVDTESGIVRWQVLVERSRIIFKSLEYPRWTTFKELILKWLSTIHEHLQLDNWPVNEIGTLFTDRFYWSLKGEEYRLDKLFNPDSELLSPNIKSKGPLWHLFQGWVETDRSREYIHNLNVSTQWETNKPHKTEVLHIIRCLKGAGSEMEGLNLDLANDAMEKAHTDNKAMLNKLLSAETIEFIGLNS